MKNLNYLYEVRNLVPTPPIYITSPGYDYKISGIIVLHYLCHYLNEIGVSCYLDTSKVSGFLNTPILTPKIYEEHYKANKKPIAIYPEIYLDNPLQVKNVVRFLLNSPGQRPWINQAEEINKFWRSEDRKKEFILHFADEFKTEYLDSSRLYVPAVNRKYYYQPRYDKNKRYGFLVYSHRAEIDIKRLPDWIRDITIVSMKNPIDPETLGNLYRKSEALLVAERTGAHIEALASGCPVIGIPNEYFNDVPSFSMFGNLGTGWGLSQDQFEWAKMSVDVFCSVYNSYECSFHVELTQRLLDIVDFFFGDK